MLPCHYIFVSEPSPKVIMTGVLILIMDLRKLKSRGKENGLPKILQ